jgi:hypothetical protein
LTVTSAPELRPAPDRLTKARRWLTRPELRIVLGVLGFAAVTLVTYLIAHYRVYIGFFFYDDEGYMLTALKSFIHHGSLYDDVFTQYGPFYYEFWGGGFSLFGIDVTHDAGRAATMGAWVVASLLVGLSTARMTASFLLGIAAQMLVFETLITLTNEPMHPGGLICLLLGAILAIACAVRARPSPGAMGLLGGAIAALVLVKINVGVFALAAVVLAAVVSYPYLRRLRWLRPLVEVGFVALPVALLSSKLGEEWARHYAAHVAIAALGIVVVLRTQFPGRRDAEELAWFVAGLGVTALVICLTVIATGTSFNGLLEGVVSQPLHQGDVFTIPLQLTNRGYVLDLVALVGALGYWYGSRRASGPLGNGWLVAASLLSILVGAWMGLSVAGRGLFFSPVNLTDFRLSMLGFAWVALVPFSERPADGSFARLLVPPLAVTQALHAFPVAGSQINWAAFLLIPTAAICVAGGVRGLARGLGERRRIGLAVAVTAAAVCMSLYLVDSMLTKPLRNYRAWYQASVSLDLPGASRLRVGPLEAPDYQRVTAAIDANCPALVMLPGMNSFYLWAEQDPPTGQNATAWPTLFDDQRERRVVKTVRTIPGLCLLRYTGLAEGWSGGPVPEGPLVRYLGEGFKPVLRVKEYELLQRPATFRGES